MSHDFKVGDHVEWISEAGKVRGTIKKKHTSEITFKGYTVRASKEAPQYEIKSDKTDHLAMHKGSVLTRVAKKQILIWLPRNLLKKVSKSRNPTEMEIPKPSPSVFRSFLRHSGAILFLASLAVYRFSTNS